MSNNVSGKNVVSMSMYKGEFQFPLVKEVEAYWHGLRGDDVVPLRSSVDPRGIERALEYAFVVERIAPGVARFRLAGTHLNDVIGMEVRGMPVTAFFTPAHRKLVAGAVEEVFSGPKIAELTLSAERGIGKPPMDAKLILLPLRSERGDISRALGCLVSIGQIGRTPRRYDVDATRLVPLSQEPQLQADNLTTILPNVTRREVPGFSDAASPFQQAPATPPRRGRPMLRVVRTKVARAPADAGQNEDSGFE